MASSLSILRYRQPVEFRIGDVVQRSWGVLSRNLTTFVLVCGIATSPIFLTQLFMSKNARHNLLWTSAASVFLNGMLTMIADAMVIYAAFQDLRGRKVSALQSVSRGLERFLSVFVVSLFAGVAIGVGLILLVVPGLILWAMFAVALPVCVVERQGGSASLSRSSELTRGHRWPIFGIAVAIVLVSAIGTGLIQAAFGRTNMVALETTLWIWRALLTSFSSVYVAILYHDLRAVHEGIGIDEIASVFD